VTPANGYAPVGEEQDEVEQVDDLVAVEVAGAGRAPVPRQLEEVERVHDAVHVAAINLVLPGEIVASDADSAGPGGATWKFSGRRMREADLELMATSRLRL
jgi:hypothetical protein